MAYSSLYIVYNTETLFILFNLYIVYNEIDLKNDFVFYIVYIYI